MATARTTQMASLEIWGGVECTVNRVGNEYRDQHLHSCHEQRLDDFDRFAELGVKALRVSLAWERIAPKSPFDIDWSWPDRALKRLQELHIRPILGLMHHGSGPRYCTLNDSNFPNQFAAFAGEVARRYPWVDAYTPVNEPLTTARFCGLSGFWHPHATDERVFARLLMNQCLATRAAMQQVRDVNPEAQLIQTENLGKTHSTQKLSYQSEFENERRWAALDLLCGLLQPDSRMWSHLTTYGIDESELNSFSEELCAPNVLGFNYYVTSERFLDHRINRYPSTLHGGNGRHRYVDTEAVRVRPPGMQGPAVLFKEAWNRFRLPLAFTEVHIGCHRESQMRWIVECWRAAQALRAQGIEVQAFTLWSLLGAYDWNTLVTRSNSNYESGVFDVRSGRCRATALVKLVKCLAEGDAPYHPVLTTPGWWTSGRSGRAVKAAVDANGLPTDENPKLFRKPLLVVGSGGTLGQAFGRVCQQRQLYAAMLPRTKLDITDRKAIKSAIAHFKPWAVVNAAGYVRVDDAEEDAEMCRIINVDGAMRLAEECDRRSIRYLTFSSDLVFDGSKEKEYLECDSVRPLGVYGHTKALAEQQVSAVHAHALVVRTSAFFGPWDRANFLANAMAHWSQGVSVKASEDEVVSPTYVPDLVHACLDLLLDEESGVWHLANRGQTSWASFARRIAERLGFAPGQVVQGVAGSALGRRAKRPSYSVLDSERGRMLPTLEDAINSFLAASAELRFSQNVKEPACESSPDEVAACHFGQK